MKLDSKIDKSLIRYLKKISSESNKSLCGGSFYFLTSDENISIRVSDHLRIDKKYPVNIIKYTDSLYNVCICDTQRIVQGEDLLLQIKALLLWVPTFISGMEYHKVVNKRLRQEYDKVRKLTDKYSKSTMSTRITNPKEGLENSQKTLTDRKEQISCLANKFSAVKDKCASLQSKINELVEILK